MTDVRLTKIDLTNFKAFSRFSVAIHPMNILVGPNNSGKSTLLGACRALSVAIKRARSRKPEVVFGIAGHSRGWKIPQDSLPISVENVRHDYQGDEALARFTFSNQNSLVLHFPEEGGCILVAEANRPVTSPSTFNREFPITVHHVPILGPVEHDEERVELETVQRSLGTHRASRHFRNYWYYFGEEFDRFASMVESTWEGMTIERPKPASLGDKRLVMFCAEDRILRELFWAGFGFQVWCQLLTHLSSARDATLLVLDEPETYLHPDLQRQLLGLLRKVAPDVILATHSTELMAEADPTEIVYVDKRKQHALRMRRVPEVQAALESVGSVHNITLTNISRHRRALFVEGREDFRLLRAFAGRLGLESLATGTGLEPVESEGSANWTRLEGAGWAIEKALGAKLALGAVFDRDYRCPEEVSHICGTLRQQLSLVHVHDRKEIENYLLVPRVLQRAVELSLYES